MQTLHASTIKSGSPLSLTGDWTIQGNIPSKVTIRCSGNLRIDGDLGDSVTIKTRGSLQFKSAGSACNLDADDKVIFETIGYESSVTAYESITGNKVSSKAKIRTTRGDVVITAMADNVTVESGGSLRFRSARTACTLNALGKITFDTVGSENTLKGDTVTGKTAGARNKIFTTDRPEGYLFGQEDQKRTTANDGSETRDNYQQSHSNNRWRSQVADTPPGNNKAQDLGCGILFNPAKKIYLIPKSLIMEHKGAMGSIINEMRTLGASVEAKTIKRKDTVVKVLCMSAEKGSETTMNKYQLNEKIRSAITAYIKDYSQRSM